MKQKLMKVELLVHWTERVQLRISGTKEFLIEAVRLQGPEEYWALYSDYFHLPDGYGTAKVTFRTKEEAMKYAEEYAAAKAASG